MIWYVTIGGAALVIFAVWLRLRESFRLFRVPETPLDERDLETYPSVSLCIPARNETHAMTDCLEQAVVSTYPKLEIIVLDDDSHDTTGELIKAFARSGVRFVEGSPLPDGWLGKNHALDELTRESSGAYILFADVDARFTPQSIDQLVLYALQENADMVSIMPIRGKMDRPSALFGTLRHFWNLIGHSKNHPTAASSAWLIKREALDALGGLASQPLVVSPEKVFAAEIAKTGVYRFVLSSPRFGVTYEKKLSSQYETAMRTYYPQFGVLGSLWRLAGLTLLLVPYIGVFIMLAHDDMFGIVYCYAVITLISLVNAWYLGALHLTRYIIHSVILPYILARECILIVRSILAYATGRVSWKGRPIRSVR